MSLAFIPLYIEYIGIEAYGLIGLFAVLTAWLSLLDVGMTPTLSREMARFTGGSHSAQSIRDLLRTIEVISFSIALFIAGGVALGSNWIASSWLNAEALPIDVIAQAIVIMGLVTALRFVESIYRSSIVGLQRQVLLNVVNSILATMRGVGAVAILAWVSPTIEAFFLWQGVVSLISLITLAAVTYSSLPKAQRMASFSIDALRSIWRFAGGMLVITFLALLLTQVDKILLSNLLTLSDFGYYMLAVAVAMVLNYLTTPILDAFYPNFVKQIASRNKHLLINHYHLCAQILSVFVGSLGITLMLWSEVILSKWTGDQLLSQNSAGLLSVLVIGTLLNRLMSVPYRLQIAYGRTDLAIKANLIAIIVIVPMILVIVPRHGPIGAAFVWAFLNAGYFLLFSLAVHRVFLPLEFGKWFLNDVVCPLGFGLVIGLAMREFNNESVNHPNAIILVMLSYLSVLFASILGSNLVRKKILKSIFRKCQRFRQGDEPNENLP